MNLYLTSPGLTRLPDYYQINEMSFSKKNAVATKLKQEIE